MDALDLGEVDHLEGAQILGLSWSAHWAKTRAAEATAAREAARPLAEAKASAPYSTVKDYDYPPTVMV